MRRRPFKIDIGAFYTARLRDRDYIAGNIPEF